MKKNLLLLLTYFAIACSTMSQSSKVDSLFSLIEVASRDSNQVKLYLQLHDLVKLSDFNVAVKVSRESFLLSEEIGWKKGIALTGRNFGIALNLLGKYDSADLILDIAIRNSIEINDASNIAYCKLTKGNIQYDQSNYDTALEFYFDALKTYKSVDDYKGMSSCLIWIGVIQQFAKSNYPAAITTYLEALDYCEKSGNRLNKGYIFGNLGIIYTDLKKFDSALNFLNKGLLVKKEFSDRRGIGNAHNNIGNVFYEVKNLDSATYHYSQALKIRTELNDQTGVASANLNLGRVFFDKNQKENALKSFKTSFELAKQLNYKECWQQAALAMSDYYEKAGQFDKSLFYFKEFKAVSDSIFNLESDQSLADAQTKYETEKKEQQIALQQVELSEQQAQNERNLVFIWSLAFVAILLVVIVLLVRSRARKKQDILLKESEIKLQEALLSSAISSQENERKRFARDLHDGFGQMISVLNLNLKSLEKGDAGREAIFENSSKVLDDMYRELKGICFNLMPETLIKNGVVDALKEFASRINYSGKVSVAIDSFGITERLPDLAEINLYRISQEWINNVLKYSDATKISLQITRDDSEITLMIEDNGLGFEKTLLTEGKGNGWRNIQSRSNLLKGELELDTTPGTRGTTLILNAPIEIPTGQNVKI